MSSKILYKNYKRLLLVVLAFIVCFSFCSCQRVIENKKDEVEQNLWQSEFENQNTVTLRFDDINATFTVEDNERLKLFIHGMFFIDDESIYIIDDETHTAFSFSYILHGDRIELIFNEKKIELSKL